MFEKFSDGYCPQCLLEDKQNSMVANSDDFWECPECKLQCVTVGETYFAILRERGSGFIKDTKATEWVKRLLLSRGDKNHITQSDKSLFHSEQELIDFLKNDVK